MKAPAMVTDATVRGDDGRSIQSNPLFLARGLARGAGVRWNLSAIELAKEVLRLLS